MGSRRAMTKDTVITKGTLTVEGLCLQKTLGFKDEEPTRSTAQSLSFPVGGESFSASIYLNPPTKTGQHHPMEKACLLCCYSSLLTVSPGLC